MAGPGAGHRDGVRVEAEMVEEQNSAQEQHRRATRAELARDCMQRGREPETAAPGFIRVKGAWNQLQ